MRSSHLLGAALLAASLPAAAAAQWSILVPESEFLAVTGRADADAAELATDGNGKFLAVDPDDGINNVLLLIDPSLPAGTQAQLVLDANSISAAVNAANGSAPDYSAATVRFQNIQYNADGDILVYVDDGTNAASLLKVEPAPPFTIEVMSTAVDGNPSPVEGGIGMTMDGNTAYILVERDFGAAEDSVLSVDTSATVTDGTAAVSFVIGEADLLPAAGQTAGDYRHSRAAMLAPGQILLVNSGVVASNDNILLVTVGSPSTASLYIDATELEAESGASDVGFIGIELDGNGHIWLANAFGPSGPPPDPTDDSLFIVSAVNSPTDVTLTVELEADVAAAVGGTNLFLGDNCLAWDASANRMAFFSGGSGTEAILVKPVTVSSVQDWSVID